jgi:hypothetical protein
MIFQYVRWFENLTGSLNGVQGVGSSNLYAPTKLSNNLGGLAFELSRFFIDFYSDGEIVGKFSKSYMGLGVSSCKLILERLLVKAA